MKTAGLSDALGPSESEVVLEFFDPAGDGTIKYKILLDFMQQEDHPSYRSYLQQKNKEIRRWLQRKGLPTDGVSGSSSSESDASGDDESSEISRGTDDEYNYG